MLVQVIDMIKTSGHLIVVEGVETEARLNLLRSTGVGRRVRGVSQDARDDRRRPNLPRDCYRP
jgi:hypothetical protein